jgi:hypothetical protein
MAGNVIDLEAPAAAGSAHEPIDLSEPDGSGAHAAHGGGGGSEPAGSGAPIDLSGPDGSGGGGSEPAGSGAPKRARLTPHRGFAFYLLRTAAEEAQDTPPHFTVSFEELTRGTWTWVLYSNYLIDERWVTTACPSLNCPLVIITHPAENGKAPARVPNLKKKPHVHVVEASLPPFGTHHSKFILLFSCSGVRVIIHTANGLYHDARDMTQVGPWRAVRSARDYPLLARRRR